MPERLPPLNALRAFEAAQRHMSFAKAAEELHVTPAALSYQIRQLEETLQVRLFTRLNRAVELTPQGKLIAGGVEESFSQLRQTLAKLSRPASQNVLVISAGPALSAHWLTPRIFRFLTQYPDVDLRVSASLNLVDLTRDDVDIALRFGRGDYPGCHSVHLMDDFLTPMCAPHLLEGDNAIVSPSDLTNARLIHDDTHYGDVAVPGWSDWLEAAGYGDTIMKHKGTHFDVPNNAIAATIAGAGVLLGRTSLVENEIRAGRLVTPFELRIKSEFSFYAVVQEQRRDEPKIRNFLNWLDEEIRNLAC